MARRPQGVPMAPAAHACRDACAAVAASGAGALLHVGVGAAGPCTRTHGALPSLMYLSSVSLCLSSCSPLISSGGGGKGVAMCVGVAGAVATP
uniref:Uncharacterized protein n=1 Tax=Oryza barthii TaxID=65489 RepID=A0A0D3EWK1_9ORYZ